MTPHFSIIINPTRTRSLFSKDYFPFTIKSILYSLPCSVLLLLLCAHVSLPAFMFLMDGYMAFFSPRTH